MNLNLLSVVEKVDARRMIKVEMKILSDLESQYKTQNIATKNNSEKKLPASDLIENQTEKIDDNLIAK